MRLPGSGTSLPIQDYLGSRLYSHPKRGSTYALSLDGPARFSPPENRSFSAVPQAIPRSGRLCDEKVPNCHKRIQNVGKPCGMRFMASSNPPPEGVGVECVLGRRRAGERSRYRTSPLLRCRCSRAGQAKRNASGVELHHKLRANEAKTTIITRLLRSSVGPPPRTSGGPPRLMPR